MRSIPEIEAELAAAKERERLASERCIACHGKGWICDTTYDRTGQDVQCDRCHGSGLPRDKVQEIIRSAFARYRADAPAQSGQEAVWLIRKGGYFYRPNRAGYTSSWAEAGRYTKAEAEAEAAIEPWHMRAIHQDDWHLPAPAQPAEEAGNGN